MQEDFIKNNSIDISFDDIQDIQPMGNRISEILKEKNISPLVSKDDLDAMNVESEEQWFRLLRNEEEPKFMTKEGSFDKSNLVGIVRWLDVAICDMYGCCFKRTKEQWEESDCGDCKSACRWFNTNKYRETYKA